MGNTDRKEISLKLLESLRWTSCLKTLTIIKDALELIKPNHGVEINIDEIR
jgi:hypothetical protein